MSPATDDSAEATVELDTSVGYLLKEASSALHAAMDDVLRPLGMTITHYSCLELLAQREGLSNSELARGAFVTRQSMNVLLQRLTHEGLVERAAVAPSGRALPTRLTERGAAQLRTASAAVRGVEARMSAGVPPRQLEQLRSALRGFVDRLERPVVPIGPSAP